jgi:hypothetical protein
MDNPVYSRSAADDLAPIRCIAQSLILLARVSPSARVLVAGSHSAVVFNELYRRRCVGFIATAARVASGCKQYDVAIVPWYRMRLDGLDVTLEWLVRSVHRHGALAIWIGRDEDKAGRKLRAMLDRVGFHIEVGTFCENGLAVVARRDEVVSLAIAA